MLWQGVRDLVPRRLGTDKDVLAWACARVTIHSSYDHLSNYAGMRACQRRTTPPAKASCVSGGGLITLHKVLARRPPKGSWIHDAPCCEGSTVCFPAPGTVAVAEKLEWRSDFVRNSSTKAASLYSHAQTSNETCVRPNGLGHRRQKLARVLLSIKYRRCKSCDRLLASNARRPAQ